MDLEPIVKPADSDISCRNINSLKIRSNDNLDRTYRSGNIQRYSRSMLNLLRSSASSTKRPECALGSNLQTLGIWKLNAASTTPQNNTSILSENPHGSKTNQSVNIRSHRTILRNTATNFSKTDFPLTSSKFHNQPQTIKPNFIDQRSISSSHLMPAFAKRRIPTIITTSQHSGENTKDELQTSTTSDKECFNFDRKVPDKSKMFDTRQKVDRYQRYMSSQAKNDRENDNDRDRNRFVEPGRVVTGQNAVITPNTRFNHQNTTTTQERRIGSGRLLPRDINWEYARDHDKAKIVHNNTMINYKDSSQLSNKGVSQREKKSYERRNSNDNCHENKSQMPASDTTRFLPPNELNLLQHSTNKNHQINYYQGIQNHPGHQRNYTRSKENDEPEWFSGGPTSQNDTIELRGFDDIDDITASNEESDVKTTTNVTGPKKPLQRIKSDSNLLNQNTEEKLKKKIESDNDIISTYSELLATNDDIANTAFALDNYSTINLTENINKATDIEKKKMSENGNDGCEEDCFKYRKNAPNFEESIQNSTFSFDSFFSLDPLDNTIMRCSAEDRNDSVIRSSRFSQWFANEVILNKQSEINSDEQQYKTQSNTLMEFLKRNNLPTPTLSKNTLPLQLSEIPSVEELEAKMRKLDVSELPSELRSMETSEGLSTSLHGVKGDTLLRENKSYPTVPVQDLEAFRKLLEQLGSVNSQQIPSVTKCKTQPMYLSPLLEHFGTNNANQNQDLMKQNKYQSPPLRTFSVDSQNIMNNITSLRNHQILIDQFPILLYLSSIEFSAYPQKQLGSQHLLQSINRGEISPCVLEKELKNPNTVPHLKDIISAVLYEISTREHVIPSAYSRENIDLAKKTGLSKHPRIQFGVNHSEINRMETEDVLKIEDNAEIKQQSDSTVFSKINIEGQVSQNLKNHQSVPLSVLSDIKQKKMQATADVQNKYRNWGIPTNVEDIQAQSQQLRSNSPPPLAFTPTSVLRKMTADKDCNVQSSAQLSKQNYSENISKTLETHSPYTPQLRQPQFFQPPPTQPRMILGGNSLNNENTVHILPQTFYQQMRNAPPTKCSPHIKNSQNTTLNKPLGRPILKGCSYSGTPVTQPIPFATRIDFQQVQQQHKIANNPILQHMINQSVQQNQYPSIYHKQPNNMESKLTHFHLQQQHFLHSQQPDRNYLHHRPDQFLQHKMNTQQQQLQIDIANSCTNLTGSNIKPNSVDKVSSPVGTYQRDSALSPTSNQLAQWFSPELLAQASAGKLPHLNMNQTLSLEEFEKSMQHSSTAVRN